MYSSLKLKTNRVKYTGVYSVTLFFKSVSLVVCSTVTI